MNSLDLILIGIMVLSIALGFYTGILKSLSSLVALALSLFFSQRYYAVAGAFMKKIHLGDAKSIVGYILIFLIFYIGIKIVFLLVQKASTASGLTSLDRILGFMLGFLRGAILCVILVVIIQVGVSKQGAIITGSKFAPWCEKAASKAAMFFPDKFVRNIGGLPD